MANWHVQFRVDGKKFSDLMEILVPMKVDGLEFKIVAGSPTKIRAGDKPAWQIVVEMADSTPRPARHFAQKLADAGFKRDGVYSAIDQAVRKRILHKTKIKGINHFKKGTIK